MTGENPLSARSRLVGAANSVLAGLNRLSVLRETPLDVDALADIACRQTGLDDFGDPWFLRPMEVLTQAIKEEASLNEIGHFAATGQFLKVLRERLWTQHWFDTHEEILAEPLAPPVIVVGPMRSGTTRLHRLLAADDRFEHMRFFETVCPVPAPGFRPGGRDPRPRQAGRLLSTVHKLNPRTAVVHPTGPFEPEEELGLLVQSAWGMKHEAQWRVPTYGRWAENEDATPAYSHLARLLRLVRWARGTEARRNRPWVLKTPQHMLDLPALLRVFPEARLIFIHRDPAKVVGSSCSLVWNQMTIHSDHADPHWIGEHWLDKTGLQIDRMQVARSRIHPRRRIDVLYRDMDANWEGVMREVYRFLEMDITPALPAMRRYVGKARSQHRWQRHRYDLGNFGLDQQTVRGRFERYANAFDLQPRPQRQDSKAIVASARRALA
ncbi:sulfotransferase family protein [Novosphingobium mangrovi (ex Huang et al. 2023)]|uniref:Sulfotransferase n=1 Tax=Novosphingobium mangrovi (ex Huang et al. 2023) TaxID=2976432 RepID=A0ABT2I1D4_9SPHN|nr:sulfotransferase [Novosphingobium mangrovi (ex Huang et al. 2023)]MCT2398618.1 sulfotransferase [Novosphingobium mangrovi (ex Huang et al. 2023)]